MKPPCDRDAAIEYATLKRLLLTPAVRTVHIARQYFQYGRTAREIAEELNTSEGSIYKTIRRVRRILAKENNRTNRDGSDVFLQKRC